MGQESRPEDTGKPDDDATSQPLGAENVNLGDDPLGGDSLTDGKDDTDSTERRSFR